VWRALATRAASDALAAGPRGVKRSSLTSQ
jgi:hypothetical protein